MPSRTTAHCARNFGFFDAAPSIIRRILKSGSITRPASAAACASASKPWCASAAARNVMGYASIGFVAASEPGHGLVELTELQCRGADLKIPRADSDIARAQADRREGMLLGFLGPTHEALTHGQHALHRRRQVAVQGGGSSKFTDRLLATIGADQNPPEGDMRLRIVRSECNGSERGRFRCTEMLRGLVGHPVHAE